MAENISAHPPEPLGPQERPEPSKVSIGIISCKNAEGKKVEYECTYTPPSNRPGDEPFVRNRLTLTAKAIADLYLQSGHDPAEMTAYISLPNDNPAAPFAKRHEITHLSVKKGQETVNLPSGKEFARADTTQKILGTATELFQDFVNAYYQQSALTGQREEEHLTVRVEEEGQRTTGVPQHPLAARADEAAKETVMGTGAAALKGSKREKEAEEKRERAAAAAKKAEIRELDEEARRREQGEIGVGIDSFLLSTHPGSQMTGSGGSSQPSMDRNRLPPRVQSEVIAQSIEKIKKQAEAAFTGWTTLLGASLTLKTFKKLLNKAVENLTTMIETRNDLSIPRFENELAIRRNLLTTLNTYVALDKTIRNFISTELKVPLHRHV